MLSEIKARLPDCMMPDGAEPCKGFLHLQERFAATEAANFRLADDALESANEVERLRGIVANLLLVGNNLTRGKATAAEWRAAVMSIASDYPPICELRQESSADHS